MLKKTITFDDLEGNKVTQDFYFNLNKAELAEMHLSMKGGMETYLRRIMAEDDNPAIIAAFKEILWKAIGRKAADGIRFEKSDEIWFEFCQTDAYNVLFMELLTNGKAAAEFIKGIVPAEMSAKIPSDISAPGELEPAGKPKRLEDYTRAQLETMPAEELADLLEKHSGNIPKEILVLAMRRTAK